MKCISIDPSPMLPPVQRQSCWDILDEVAIGVVSAVLSYEILASTWPNASTAVKSFPTMLDGFLAMEIPYFGIFACIC